MFGILLPALLVFVSRCVAWTHLPILMLVIFVTKASGLTNLSILLMSRLLVSNIDRKILMLRSSFLLMFVHVCSCLLMFAHVCSCRL